MTTAPQEEPTAEQESSTTPMPSDATRPLQLRRPARRSAGDSGCPATHREWNGHDRRSTDRIKRLSREFDALCTAAVDAAEIAAGLESLGFTDSTALEYGFPDVFRLADSLYQQTPRIVNRRPGRLANPWAERPLHHLARGATFALPGLIFVACLPGVTQPIDFVALVVALLLSWPTGQVVALLGHTLEGRRHPMAAQAVLVSGLAFALLLAAAYGGIALWGGATPRIAALGTGEIVYTAAAAVVLVMGREWAVLGSLAPGITTATLAWRGVTSSRSIAIGASATVALIVVAAVLTCAMVRPPHLRAALGGLTRHDWHDVGFHASYGISGGILVTLPALVNKNSADGGLSLLPVTWSMGFAEWRIVSLRRQSFALLNEAISMEFFRLSVWRLAQRSVLTYLSCLTVLTAGLLMVVWAVTNHGMPPVVLISNLASWLLGLAFYLALVLSSLGRMRVVVQFMAASVVLGLTVNVLLPWQPLILVAPTALALLLVNPAKSTIRDPTRHM